MIKNRITDNDCSWQDVHWRRVEIGKIKWIKVKHRIYVEYYFAMLTRHIWFRSWVSYCGQYHHLHFVVFLAAKESSSGTNIPCGVSGMVSCGLKMTALSKHFLLKTQVFQKRGQHLWIWFFDRSYFSFGNDGSRITECNGRQCDSTLIKDCYHIDCYYISQFKDYYNFWTLLLIAF